MMGKTIPASGIQFPSNYLRVWALVISDVVSFCAALGIALLVYSWIHPKADLEIYRNFWPVPLGIVAINLFTRVYCGDAFYPGASICETEEIRRLSFSGVMSFLLFFLHLQIMRKTGRYSLPVYFSSMILTVFLLPLARSIARWILVKFHLGYRDVFIAGAGITGEIVGQALKKDMMHGFRAAGYFDDDPKKHGKVISGIPVLGRLTAAPRLSRKMKIDYLICCLPMNLYAGLLPRYTRYFRHIMIVPDNRVFPILSMRPTSVDCIGALELHNSLLLPTQRYMKLLLDIFFSVLVVILALPIFLTVYLLVRLSSPGPVFYQAKRLGVNGKKILVYKFRTMYDKSDSKIESILENDPVLKGEWERKFKLEKDPRVTRIGGFLRRTSLDELPQFLNVLKGEMAVIGPRPIVEDEVKFYGKDYDMLKFVRPGITGLWQVSGRSDLDYNRRVMLDMYYISNWSIWLDYFIFFKTIKEIFICRGSR